jgi:hypothetical protein
MLQSLTYTLLKLSVYVKLTCYAFRYKSSSGTENSIIDFVCMFWLTFFVYILSGDQ